MIVLDFETNSKNPKDVLEIGALKIKKQGNTYVVVNTFHRYYHSKYDVDPWALDVHNLSPERISIFRKGVRYAKYFEDDNDFKVFCQNTSTLIAHNISFELRYIDNIVIFENHFCTMKTNTDNVGARKSNGHRKPPTLLETCKHYNISFNTNQYHSALYDAHKTLDILNKMNTPYNNFDIVFEVNEKNRAIKNANQIRKQQREENKIKKEQDKEKRVSKRTMWSNLVCPHCSSHNFIFKGKQQNKKYKVRKFLCKDCSRMYTKKVDDNWNPIDLVSKSIPFNNKNTTEFSTTPTKSKNKKKTPVVKAIPKFEYILLETPKDTELIERIKEIPGRKWNSNMMYWGIPFCENYQSFLESKFGDIANVSCRNGRDVYYLKIIRAKITLFRTPSFNDNNKVTEGCYIATAVYGSYEAPEVLKLRKFRDTQLKNYLLGRFLISFYYAVSPSLANKLKDMRQINNFTRLLLDKFIKLIG